VRAADDSIMLVAQARSAQRMAAKARRPSPVRAADGSKARGTSPSPRSGRQHKAWGASPRKAMIAPKDFEPVITGDCAGAVARYRGLGCSFLSVTWGLRPRLYAVVRFADSAPCTCRA